MGGLGPMVDCSYPYFDFFKILKLKQIIHNPLNDKRNLKNYKNTIIQHFKRTYKKMLSISLCRGPRVRSRTECMIWSWLKKKFNFKDGGYPYDTKCVSDHIDDKYNKKIVRKKIKISVPNSSRGGGSQS